MAAFLSRRGAVLAPLAALVLALPARAADYPAELPPLPMLQAAIEAAPEVRAAEALREGGEAERRQLAAGPYEWTLNADYGRRRTREAGVTARTGEWEVALERPLRLPGKAGLDERLGDLKVKAAELGLADARHETARALLAAWYDWLREQAGAGVLRAQAEAAAREAAAVTRRAELGDASRLDAMQAEAAAAQAAAAARLGEGRAAAAAAALRQRYPQLALPARPPLPDPAPPGADMQELVELALEHDHGLLLARSAAARAEAESQRAAAQRRPDPTFGVRYGRERDSAEHMVGAYVAIPLGGSYRNATADMARASAAAAAEQANAAERRLAGELRARHEMVIATHDHWRLAEDSAARLAAAAERLALAQRLGEAPLAEVLLARRQALEAALQASGARVDALAEQASLRLAAHRLWADGEDHGE
ncbi:hypothetical protein dqs_0283 [Azoarcus olearius]|uniref:TolC family protein n=1 Tax=Azoarcus sp. (strain BH72) TaxID=418699 RepID=UPI0008061E63|nr:TolC family protein [Azoarcus olearius]ANQ83360.1 hypothetical protein dqs_0283 [Azoarcus olearius]